MKNLKSRSQKILSVFLVFSIIVSMFTGFGITASAAVSTNPNFVKVADPSTMDGWKSFFGSQTPTTVNAGGVWTDKSVFADNSAFQNLTDAYGESIIPTVADDSFLVALSAIASNKSIVGYSHIPTDTVLALDISGSMGPGSNNNDAIGDLVLAANAAITELLELNNNNRVGVLLYSAEYNLGNDYNYYTLLPIDRYTATNTVTYEGNRFDPTDDITVYEYLRTNSDENEISIASGVKNGSGNMRTTSIDVVGGTYIQGGLGAVEDMFKAKHDDDDTVVKGDGFQGGTQRKPVIVLMSDGAPTYSTTNFTNPGDYTLGNGSSATEVNAFLTQLTAAYIKEKMTEYYGGSEALFYTLGLGVGNNTIAESVLDPANSTTDINDYWTNYKSASNGATVEIVNEWGTSNDVSVVKSNVVDDIVYVDRYFEADSRNDLFDAFDSIVNEIIIQSLYRPTLVEENDANMTGYIEFIDDIGDYMKVQQIEGIMIGDKLYTGEKLCENFREGGGQLGTIANPNALGDNLIWAVKERLGIQDTAVAQRLVTLAYEHGQLSYTDGNNYSNYIGWYADKDGKFLGFWDESHTYSQIPDGAVFVNKSYGMLGEIADGYNISDLMYVSIQVHTEIADQTEENASDNDKIIAGHAQLIYRIPASLIPVVTYDVTLEGTSYDDAKNIEMTVKDAEPIRLLFEVGLRDDVNIYNIEEELGANCRGNDGKYRLYTNEWSVEQFEKEQSEDIKDYVAPTEAINTVAFFEPSLANERYYYTEPTPVYIYDAQNDRYVKYSSSVKPVATDGTTYYRQMNIFELTAATTDGKAAILKKEYEKISNAALENVVESETNGGWNIPKDVIHRIYDDVEHKKLDDDGDPYNPTGTLEYASYPAVEHIEGVHYYADNILGNNGLLTVTPATGIKITKTVDTSLVGTTTDFVFNVDIGNEQANYNVVYLDPNGNFIEDDENEIVLDANGKGTLSLKAGWSAYIVGVPAGVSYEVTESIPSGARYELASNPDNMAGTIELYHLADIKFVNTLKKDGNLVIAKRVVHPFATTPESMNDKVFKFDIVLNGTETAYPDTTVDAYYSTAPDTAVSLTVSDKRIEDVPLHNNESIVIKIRDNWSAVVTEDQAMPDGFKLLESASTIPTGDDTTVTIDTNVVYEFVNEYKPDAVSPDITINGSKNFTGRPWDNDTFTFVLRRYDPVTAQYIEITGGSESVTDPQSGTSVDFGDALTEAIKAVSFDKVGTYHYSIKEVVPENTKGITYDAITRDFNIIVDDVDTDGKLEISSVTNANCTTVTKGNNNDYTVAAEVFTNTYAASGIAEIVFQINKSVEAPEGVDYSPEGFEFGFYEVQSGQLYGSTNFTDADGIAQFVFAYNADNVDYANPKKYEYLIKETNSHIAGMTYAEDIPVTVTVKDNLDGTISATANIGQLTANGVTIVEVANVYNPDDTKASVVVEVDKTVENKGTATIGPEDFDFTLKSDDGTVGLEATTDKNGFAEFVLDYTAEDVGNTYNYVLKEVKGEVEDVEYSEAEYNISVSVYLDEATNKVGASVVCNETEISDGKIVAEFVNTYTADLPVPDPEPDTKPEPKPEAKPPVKSPQTGDSNNLSLWFAVMFVSGGSLFGAAIYSKKSKKEKES